MTEIYTGCVISPGIPHYDSIAGGEIYTTDFASGILRGQIHEEQITVRAHAPGPLTPIMCRDLDCTAYGDEHGEIAGDFEVQPTTVSNNLTRAYKRLGARNATHAVRIATHNNLLALVELTPMQQEAVFSAAEIDILALTSVGLAVPEIAWLRGIKRYEVRNVYKDLRERLGARNLTQLVAVACALNVFGDMLYYDEPVSSETNPDAPRFYIDN